jgi:hypothetical protein
LRCFIFAFSTVSSCFKHPRTAFLQLSLSCSIEFLHAFTFLGTQAMCSLNLVIPPFISFEHKRHLTCFRSGRINHYCILPTNITRISRYSTKNRGCCRVIRRSWRWFKHTCVSENRQGKQVNSITKLSHTNKWMFGTGSTISKYKLN